MSWPGEVVDVVVRGETFPGLFLADNLIELGPAGLLVDLGEEIIVDDRPAIVVGFERHPRPARKGFWNAKSRGIQVVLQWEPPKK